MACIFHSLLWNKRVKFSVHLKTELRVFFFNLTPSMPLKANFDIVYKQSTRAHTHTHQRKCEMGLVLITNSFARVVFAHLFYSPFVFFFIPNLMHFILLNRLNNIYCRILNIVLGLSKISPSNIIQIVLYAFIRTWRITWKPDENLKLNAALCEYEM